MRGCWLLCLFILSASTLGCGAANELGQKSVAGKPVDSARPPSGWVFTVESTEPFIDVGGPSHTFLRSNPPTDVEIDFPVNEGTLYGQLRYGTDDSRRIALVFAKHEDKWTLYADTNRDRSVSQSELIKRSADNSWIFDLDAELIEKQSPIYFPRRIELTVLDGQLIASSHGYLEGDVEFQGEQFVSRRTDGNANGLMNETKDRIWIDLNKDGRWDPLDEQFAAMPVIWIDGERYKVITNLIGDQLRLEPVTGSGDVKLRLADESLSERILSFQAILVDESGVYLSITKLDEPVKAPIGRYRVHSIDLTLKDKEQEPWAYFFYPSDDIDHVWYDLPTDASIEVDPIGTVRLELEKLGANTKVKPNATTNLQPTLLIGDGLFLTRASVGNFKETEPKATTVFKCPKGDEFSSKQSGFF